jgi:hypothetical protein
VLSLVYNAYNSGIGYAKRQPWVYPDQLEAKPTPTPPSSRDSATAGKKYGRQKPEQGSMCTLPNPHNSADNPDILTNGKGYCQLVRDVRAYL